MQKMRYFSESKDKNTNKILRCITITATKYAIYRPVLCSEVTILSG